MVARWTVGDREPQIAEALSRALEQADVVLVTGGLGPTPDDRTREAVAGLLGLPLRVDPELLEALEERFRSRGYDPMPPGNVAQASVPEGAHVLGNPVGTAPALAIETEGKAVLLFPGVPAELERVFTERAEPYLRTFLGPRLTPLRHVDIHTTGLPESEVAARLAPVVATLPDGVDVAFLPHVAAVTIRLTVRDAGTGAVALEAARSAVLSILGDYSYEAPTGDLVEAVAQALIRSGLTVATAESCTGGLVAKRLTDRSGSSTWYLGGVVAYANRAKIEALGVDPALLASRGAVSGEVAEAMAAGAAARFGADCGLGITGIAGPSGGTPDKPVGTVWYAARVGENVESRMQRFVGNRALIRERAAQAVLDLLLRLTQGQG